MKIILSNIIEIENPTQEIIDYCKKELTFNNPDYTKKKRMGFWVAKTPKTITLYEFYYGKLYVPMGCFDDIWNIHPIKSDYKDYSVVVPRNIESNMTLRNYQQPCINALKKYVNGIFLLFAGAGKTNIALQCASELKQHTLFLTHTKDLLNQAKTRCEDNLICTTSEITSGKCDYSGDIVFATVQTLVNVIDKGDIRQDEFGLIVTDECFPKGTPISTPNGYVNIEDIKYGDNVYSYNHTTNKIEIKKVNYLFNKNTSKLYKIKTKKHYLICTGNHPIYTQNGYVEAKDLQKGDVIYEMCNMWKTIKRRKLSNHEMVIQEKNVYKMRFYKLLTGMCKKMVFSKNDKIQSGTQSGSFSTHENKKPNAQSTNKRKSFASVERNWTQAKNTWWKWSRNDNSPKDIIRKIENNRKCDSRICYKNKNETRFWLSNLLQNRFSYCGQKYSNRDRWQFPFIVGKTKTRLKENIILRELRVKSVEIYQQGNFRECRNSYGQNTVFNIGVEDNHNYFAKNILVHNCHHLATNAESVKMFEKCINYFSARYKIGITATLYRADGLQNTTTKILGNVIYELKKDIKRGSYIGIYEDNEIMNMPISQFQVPAQINMLKTTYSTLNKDVYDRNDNIVFSKLITSLATDLDRNKQVLDIINKCKGYTIVISERIDQLEYLHNRVPNSVYINGKTNKKIREQTISDFRNGEHRVLFASYSLVAEGLDIPILENLVMASPVKDERLVIQSVGRIQRPCSGKQIANVFDLVDDVGLLDKFTRERKKVYKREGWDINGI